MWRCKCAEATYASLDEASPDHLPRSEWVSPTGYLAEDAVKDWVSKGMIVGPLGRRRPLVRSKWTHSNRDTGV